MKKKHKEAADSSVDRISKELDARYQAAVAALDRPTLRPKASQLKTPHVLPPDAHESVVMGTSNDSLHYSLRAL